MAAVKICENCDILLKNSSTPSYANAIIKF